MTDINTVVCVHGIWMHGATLLLLKRRLEKEHGLDVHLFSYPSITGTLDENANRLADFIATQGFNGAHVIGHSLGGVIALRMFAINENTVPGRVLAMGAPLTGSRAASFLSTQDWAAPILGKSLPAGVVETPANEWASGVCEVRDVGIIAGTLPYGLGQLVATFDGENDGTIAVAETRLDGAKDHLCMRVCHSTMVLSADVASQAAAFLKRGEFLRDSV